jgi:hypothetical protein
MRDFMMKRYAGRLSALIVPFVFASTAQAQVFTPTFTSSRLINEIGVYVSDGPGDLALEGVWRSGPIGLRVGWVDHTAGGLLSLGGELRTPIVVPEPPLGLAFTAGAQGLLGDLNAGGVQAGLSAGYTFMGTGVAFTPYMHPRIGMINHLGPNRDWEFEVMADVGVDVELHNNVVVRLGVALDDVGSNWGVGVSWRRAGPPIAIR